MNVNILLIVVAAVMILCMVDGYKKGMVKEIISFVSLIIISIVAVLIANAVHSYVDGKIVNVILVLLFLSVIGTIRTVLGIVFFSAKAVSKLPVISWVDKALGILMGVFETVILLWTLYIFVMLMDLGVFGEKILYYTHESEILLWFCRHNYLAELLEKFGTQLSQIAIF